VPCHALPGALLKLESLPVADNEMQAARAASDSVYDIAYETPMFRFLIEPGNIWVQRAFAIGAYAIPKAITVRAELQARRMKSAQPNQNKGNQND